jgi:hypothetical protein
MKSRAGFAACLLFAGMMFFGCGGGTPAPQTSGSMSQDYMEKSKALGRTGGPTGGVSGGSQGAGNADVKKYKDAQSRGS